MLKMLASSIVPRTTIDIDASVLREVKKLARAANKSLGDIVSELLAVTLRKRPKEPTRTKLAWRSKDMKPRIDLEDKEAVYRALDGR